MFNFFMQHVVKSLNFDQTQNTPNTPTVSRKSFYIYLDLHIYVDVFMFRYMLM
jgi:hypothetical protein